MLHATYQPTDPRSDLLPSRVFNANSRSVPPTVGAYNQGLIMVVDELSSDRLLASWSWLLGKQCLAMITTGFGDVFFWKPGNGIHFLHVQRAEVEFVDSEIDWFMQEFLVNPDIIDQALRKGYVEQLIQTYRPLKYEEIFILEPWLMLGGEDKPQNYNIGNRDTYLDLVGQEGAA